MSPPTPTPTLHDVFLSFRGEDTRNGFTGHLYAALCRENINTFIDDRLNRGDHISDSLRKAIEESAIYVIVFSEHYAYSTWCLDELTQILECKEKFGRLVIPIFYKVDPSNVRHQRGSYADAFVKHEKRFKEELILKWKAALTQVAGFSGWDSKNRHFEYLLVEEIAKDIRRKLYRSPFTLSDCQGQIGIHKHVAQIKSILHVEATDVRIIGIWGIGGIGKTTIASAVYKNLAPQFSSSSFVEKVHEEIERFGIRHVKSNYLSELRAKALLILDDVNNSGQLKDLIGGRDAFDQGSRIIVTSRDMQVLKNVDADEIYEVDEMSFQESLQLFSFHAFKQNYPIGAYMGLSEKVLNYAKGIPLALKVLGLSLQNRTEEEWESALGKLKKQPEGEIFGALKLSYDRLDDEEKDIFLEIACFYRGHDMNTVKQILDSCGFSATIGMRVLIDRGLISILKGEIVLHDLIHEMGLEIVRQQCVNDPGKRSRLWKHEDVYHVLRKNKGTDSVQCIFLDMCRIKEVQLNPQTFKMMHNLRLLQFYKSSKNQGSNVYIPSFLLSLPDDLRFLRWDAFPQRSLPLDFSPENLVQLDMRDSQLEQLWEGDQHLPNLKKLDLSGSRKLIRIPDLSGCPNIEEVILSECKELVQVYSSGFLSRLKCLWLNGCVELRSLIIPSNILSRSLGLIVLYNCCNLKMFSVSSTNTGFYHMVAHVLEHEGIAYTETFCPGNWHSASTNNLVPYLRNSHILLTLLSLMS
ncbi:disease resistance protein RPV1-like [Vicia villosa]|uniref:disease resistance protein RPV1-like n=1 Tax=Vicia villosa TaxID=3911 RepID=UPI00273ABBC9|nr:disease resistance protein RPV1-like [Vicia villosa]